MQYVLKLTVLGCEQKVFRVVSVEGKADISHVLNLCNLSFDYSFYDQKALYFPLNQEAYKLLSFGFTECDQYDPSHNQFCDYWKNTVDFASCQVIPLSVSCDLLLLNEELKNRYAFDQEHSEKAVFAKISLGQNQWASLQRADVLLDQMYQVLNHEQAIVDQHPSQIDPNKQQKFIYEVNGVTHLVEVMTLSEKLKCFLPATLMGEGLICDNDQQLSLALIEQCLQNNADDDSLNLKECTSRMRALGAMRADEFISQALVKAGTPELKFKRN